MIRASVKAFLVLVVFLSVLARSDSTLASSLLRFVEHQSDPPVLAPVDIALSPDDRHVILLGDSALTVMERDPATGLAHYVESHVEGRRGVSGLLSASALAISGDGRFVYTASPFQPRPDGIGRAAVAVFERQPATGGLTQVGMEIDGFEAPGSAAHGVHAVISPDDAHLYVVSTPDQAVLGFARDPATGALRLLDSLPRDLGVGPVFATFDRRGRHLYVTSEDRGSVTVLGRNPATGRLRFVEDLMSDDPRGDRLFPVFPGALAVSPQGSRVYVANLSAFPFDAAAGRSCRFAATSRQAG